MNEIINLTCDLMRIPSMHSSPEEIMRCADFIMHWCHVHNMAAKKIVHNGVPSILVMPAHNRTRLLLMSHIDVVDAPSAMFMPQIEGDRLLGRGAIDDKYAVALSLILFRDHLRTLREKGFTQDDMVVGLLITGDEETGGRDGAGQALQQISAEYALALDGGAPGRVITREKGVLDVVLTATGKAAHGARPWLGVNAIELLMADCMRLHALFPDLGGDHWHKTANLGKIRAGESMNQVPQTAKAWINIRFTENETPEELLRQIREVVTSDVELLGIVPVFASLPTPLTDRLVSLIPGAIQTREHGASDARYLMDHGIPGAIWGAEGFGTQHGPNECVSITSVETVAKTLSALVTELETAAGLSAPVR